MIFTRTVKSVVFFVLMLLPTYAWGGHGIVIFTNPPICPPCQRLEQTLKTPEVKRVIKESGAKVYKIDPIHDPKARAYMERLKLTVAIPTIVVVDLEHIYEVLGEVDYMVDHPSLFAKDLEALFNKLKQKSP